MDKDGGDLLMRCAKPYSEALEETVHTVFRHRCSIKDDLGHVKDEGENDGNLHSFERPDVDTLDIFPASQCRETGNATRPMRELMSMPVRGGQYLLMTA